MQITGSLRHLAYLFLFLMFFPFLTKSQWTTVGTAGFSAGTISNAYSAAATDANDAPYVAYIDAGNGNKASVMKYNGSSWVTVGSAGFSIGQVSDIDMAIAPDGTPYVVYQDFANGHKPTVMRFNGSTWVGVGNTGLSFGSVTNTNIAVDVSGTPYVFYRGITGVTGGGDSLIAMVVRKYNGSTWTDVGGTSFSAIYDLWYADFALAPDGTPYVAYSDGDEGGNVSVKKYDGSNWVYAGVQSFSTGVGGGTMYGSGDCPRLAIDGSGTPYILFTSSIFIDKLTVMKYDGINWITVGGGAPGSASFTATDSTATNPSLVLSPGGTPYVAYKDHNGAISVKKYNGSNWVYVGGTNFTAGSSEYPMLTFTPNGTLYMVYADGGNTGKASAKMFANQWTGSVDTDWNTGGNWSADIAPAFTDDAVIPAGCTNYPNIISTLTPVCNNLTIESTASVTVGTSGMISIYGSINNSGTFTATSGKIKMAGSLAQTIPASTFNSNTIQDLEISNSAGVTLGGTLGLTGTLTPTSGTITTGGFLTLKSSASGTARITAGSGSYLSGTVTIERYIPGGRRVFRFLGNPTTAALPLSNLQDDIYVTGSGGTTNGFDSTQTQNPSAFWYDNTAAGGGSWTAITNTSSDNSWTPQRGLRILVRGDRTQPTTLTGVNPTPNPVTLDITGTMKTGNQTINLTNSNAYHLLANPYASPTDIGTVIDAASNIGTQYWVWDAQSGTRGAYVTKTRGSGAYSIPSMGAFMVLPTGSSTLSFTESNKTSAESNGNSFFRTNNSVPGMGELKLLFNGYPSDNIFIRKGDANTAPGFDATDGKKLWNQDINIYFRAATGDSLSLDSRPFADSVIIPLGFSTNITTASYAFVLDNWGIDGYDLFLRDKLLNTEQKLAAGDVYNFSTTTGNPGISRFEIVLKPAAVLPLSALQLTAQQKGNDIQLQWNITGEETAVRYEVEYSRDGKSFEKIATQNANGTKAYSWLHTAIIGTTHYYRIKSIPANGAGVYSAAVKISTGKTGASISVNPNPVKQGDAINLSLSNLEKGIYNICITDAAGKRIQQTTIDHAGGSTVKTVAIHCPGAGLYTVTITGTGLHFKSQLLVQ